MYCPKGRWDVSGSQCGDECSANRNYSHALGECVDCSAKNKGYSPLKGECNNCKPSCTQCCDGCEINAKGEIVYKMGGRKLTCKFTRSRAGRWCQTSFPLIGNRSDTHCTDASKTGKWCNGYGYFEQSFEKWCCPRKFISQTDVMTFKVPKVNEKGTDRTYINSMNDCQYEKGESHGKPGCSAKETICTSKMGLMWKEPEEEAKILAKCVLPNNNAMLGKLKKVCLRCKDGYKLDGKHCVEIPKANRKKIVAGEDLRLLSCRYPESQPGAWCHTTGGHPDSIGSCDKCRPYGYHRSYDRDVCCPRFFKGGEC